MSKSAVAAKRRKQKIKPEDLAPGIAEGLTVGMPAEQALDAHPVKPVRSLSERFEHMRDTSRVAGSRVSNLRFVAKANDQLITDHTGRTMRDADTALDEEQRREIQAGHKCLRCYEPQPIAFPELCDLCGYPMRERQILDWAMESEGEVHLGPRKPIAEFLDAQDERLEKRKFIKRVLDGKQGRIPKEWLRDATLLEGLTPDERRMIGSH